MSKLFDELDAELGAPAPDSGLSGLAGELDKELGAAAPTTAGAFGQLADIDPFGDRTAFDSLAVQAREDIKAVRAKLKPKLREVEPAEIAVATGGGMGALEGDIAPSPMLPQTSEARAAAAAELARARAPESDEQKAMDLAWKMTDQALAEPGQLTEAARAATAQFRDPRDAVAWIGQTIGIVPTPITKGVAFATGFYADALRIERAQVKDKMLREIQAAEANEQELTPVQAAFKKALVVERFTPNSMGRIIGEGMRNIGPYAGGIAAANALFADKVVKAAGIPLTIAKGTPFWTKVGFKAAEAGLRGTTRALVRPLDLVGVATELHALKVRNIMQTPEVEQFAVEYQPGFNWLQSYLRGLGMNVAEQVTEESSWILDDAVGPLWRKTGITQALIKGAAGRPFVKFLDRFGAAILANKYGPALKQFAKSVSRGSVGGEWFEEFINAVPQALLQGDEKPFRVINPLTPEGAEFHLSTLAVMALSQPIFGATGYATSLAQNRGFQKWAERVGPIDLKVVQSKAVPPLDAAERALKDMERERGQVEAEPMPAGLDDEQQEQFETFRQMRLAGLQTYIDQVSNVLKIASDANSAGDKKALQAAETDAARVLGIPLDYKGRPYDQWAVEMRDSDGELLRRDMYDTQADADEQARWHRDINRRFLAKVETAKQTPAPEAEPAEPTPGAEPAETTPMPEPKAEPAKPAPKYEKLTGRARVVPTSLTMPGGDVELIGRRGDEYDVMTDQGVMRVPVGELRSLKTYGKLNMPENPDLHGTEVEVLGEEGPNRYKVDVPGKGQMIAAKAEVTGIQEREVPFDQGAAVEATEVPPPSKPQPTQEPAPPVESAEEPEADDDAARLAELERTMAERKAQAPAQAETPAAPVLQPPTEAQGGPGQAVETKPETTPPAEPVSAEPAEPPEETKLATTIPVTSEPGAGVQPSPARTTPEPGLLVFKIGDIITDGLVTGRVTGEATTGRGKNAVLAYEVEILSGREKGKTSLIDKGEAKAAEAEVEPLPADVNSFYITAGEGDEAIELGPILSMTELRRKVADYGDMPAFEVVANMEAGEYAGKQLPVDPKTLEVQLPAPAPSEAIKPVAEPSDAATAKRLGIHEDSARDLRLALEAKDPDALKKLLHPDNKQLRKQFVKETGWPLPKGVGDTKTALDEWAAAAKRGETYADVAAKRSVQDVADFLTRMDPQERADFMRDVAASTVLTPDVKDQWAKAMLDVREAELKAAPAAEEPSVEESEEVPPPSEMPEPKTEEEIQAEQESKDEWEARRQQQEAARQKIAKPARVDTSADLDRVVSELYADEPGVLQQKGEIKAKPGTKPWLKQMRWMLNTGGGEKPIVAAPGSEIANALSQGKHYSMPTGSEYIKTIARAWKTPVVTDGHFILLDKKAADAWKAKNEAVVRRELAAYYENENRGTSYKTEPRTLEDVAKEKLDWQRVVPEPNEVDYEPLTPVAVVPWGDGGMVIMRTPKGDLAGYDANLVGMMKDYLPGSEMYGVRGGNVTQPAVFKKGKEIVGLVMPIRLDAEFDYLKSGLPAAEPTAQPPAATKPVAEMPIVQPVPTPTSEAGLTDFGEKIGGARKDLWQQRGMTLAEAQGLTTSERDVYATKAHVFPAIDYAAMVEAGTPREIAWLVKKVKDSISAAPTLTREQESDPAKREAAQLRYVEVVGNLKDRLAAVKTLADIKQIQADLFPTTPTGYGGRPELTAEAKSDMQLLGGRRLLEEIQPSDYDVSQAQRRLAREQWPAKQEAWQRQFDIHHTKPGDVVYRKGQREAATEDEWWVTKRKQYSILADGFETKEEAENWAREHVAAQGGERLTRPLVENVVRTGPDYRGGKDVSGQDILDTFGFRGGEFGNWTNDADRQQSLNQAYDGLMDLSRVLGIPPNAVGLNGQLGIAFGARGSGSAAAHYEPARIVINLTRTRGAGSLAHEWAHAVDDYFGRMAAGQARQYLSHGSVTKKVRKEVLTAWAKVMDAVTKRQATKEENIARVEKDVAQGRTSVNSWLGGRVLPDLKGMAQETEVKDLQTMLLGDAPMMLDGKPVGPGQVVSRLAAVYRQWTGKGLTSEVTNALIRGGNWMERALREMDKAVAGDIQRTVGTDFYETAKKLGKGKSDNYWARMHEMFARAFENFVARDLEADGKQSDYLVAHAKGDTGTKWSRIYPKGEEAVAIGKAFRDLWDVIKTQVSTTKPGVSEMLSAVPAARFPTDAKPLADDPAYRDEVAKAQAAAADLGFSMEFARSEVTRTVGRDALTASDYPAEELKYDEYEVEASCVVDVTPEGEQRASVTLYPGATIRLIAHEFSHAARYFGYPEPGELPGELAAREFADAVAKDGWEVALERYTGPPTAPTPGQAELFAAKPAKRAADMTDEEIEAEIAELKKRMAARQAAAKPEGITPADLAEAVAAGEVKAAPTGPAPAGFHRRADGTEVAFKDMASPYIRNTVAAIEREVKGGNNARAGELPGLRDELAARQAARAGRVTVVPPGTALADATKALNDNLWTPWQQERIKEEAGGSQRQIDVASGLLQQLMAESGVTPEAVKSDPKLSTRMLMTMRAIIRSGGKVAVARAKLRPGRESNLYDRLSSARIAISKLELRTGTAWLPAFVAIEETSTHGHQIIHDTVRKMSAEYGLPKHGTPMSPEAIPDIAAWMFEANPDVKENLWEKVKTYGKLVEQYANLCNDIYQGESAHETREAEWWQWKDEYDIYAPRLALAQAELEAADRALAAAAPDATNRKKLENAKVEALAEVKRYDAAVKRRIPPNAKLDRMIAGVTALREGGKDGLRKFIRGETWGTRRYYYPSEPLDARDYTDELMELLPSHEVEPVPLPGGVPGARPEGAEPRTAEGRPRATQSIIGLLMRHWHKNWVYNRTRDQFKALQGAVETATANRVPLSRSDVRAINEHLRNATGRFVGDSEAMAVVARVAVPLNNAFWRAYFLDPQRLIWWMGRQVPQQVAWGGSYMTPRAVLATVKVLAGKMSKGKLWAPETREAMLDYPWKVAQRHEIAERLLRETEPQKLGTVKNRFELLSDWLAEIASLSDEAPRFLTYAASFEHALKMVREYQQDGKLTKLSFELGLDGFPETMSARMFLDAKSGDAVKFAKNYALAQADAINFRYATSSRAAVEQTPGARAIVGLYTFPRGTAELIYYKSLKQIYTGLFDGGGVAMALRGIMSFVGMLMSAGLTYAMLMAVCGRGDYQLPGVLAWTPFSPGVSIMADFIGRLATAVNRTFTGAKPGDEDWRKSVATAWLSALMTPSSMVPFAGNIMSYVEAKQGVRGITLGKVVAHWLGLTDADYPLAERTSTQSIIHVLFGGYERGAPTESGGSRMPRERRERR